MTCSAKERTLMVRQVRVAACGLVQVIQLRWGKSARGGQGARDRNAVPLAFEVSADELLGAADELVVVESRWGARNAFVEPLHRSLRRVATAAGYRFGCVSVSANPEALSVRYQYDTAHGGAPDRWFFNSATGFGEAPGRNFVVRPGQWVRIRYNGRFSCVDTGNWWYEQVTVNVALFRGVPSGQVFVGSEPSQDLVALAEFW
jgi:hypothetical protein